MLLGERPQDLFLGWRSGETCTKSNFNQDLWLNLRQSNHQN